MSNFWHLDCCNFWYPWKKLRSYTYYKPCLGLRKHAKNHIYKATHYWETAHKKVENFVLFGVFYFKNRNSWHSQFSISQIFRQSFSASENSTYKSQLLLTLRAVKLAVSFLSISLSSSWWQTGENSRKLDDTYFSKLTPKKLLLKVSRSLTHPPQNNNPLKFLRNWTETTF